jgi:hypothetical protein
MTRVSPQHRVWGRSCECRASPQRTHPRPIPCDTVPLHTISVDADALAEDGAVALRRHKALHLLHQIVGTGDAQAAGHTPLQQRLKEVHIALRGRQERDDKRWGGGKPWA